MCFPLFSDSLIFILFYNLKKKKKKKKIYIYIYTSVNTVTIALLCMYFINMHNIILVMDDIIILLS